MSTKKKNNRANCGRKGLDWIDKKSQITLSVPNKDAVELTGLNGKQAVDALRELLNKKVPQIIEVVR